MKRTLCALLAAVFLLLAAGTGRAALLPAPQTALLSQTAEAFVFSVSSPQVRAYEAQRRAALADLRKSRTDEEIAASAYGNLLYPAGLLCEGSVNGGAYVPLRLFAPDGDEATATLAGDVLPGFAAGGVYESGDFSFTLRFTGAVRTEDGYVALTEPGADASFFCPARSFIEYRLPAGADNSGNPAVIYGAFDAPLRLASPTAVGMLFDGWQKEDGTYTDVVPAGSPYTVLTARFTPRTYRITYILTTREGFFTRVPNDANPKSYVYGETTPIYDLPPTYSSVTAPQRYEFCGWYENPDLTGEQVTEIPPARTGDVLLYAKWLTEDERVAEEVAAARWGDLNDDGRITAADARLALRSAVDLENLPDELIARADFARLGTLNAGYARLLLRVAVGLENMPAVLKAYGRI